MKTNEFVVARTHKDFLNELLELNLGGYMKSTKALYDGKLLWMIRLDGKVSKSGWRNYISTLGEIIEEHIGNEFVFKGQQTYLSGGGNFEKFETRVIFDLVEFGSYRKYIFRGVFRIDKEKCTYNKNVWHKISDEYKF